MNPSSPFANNEISTGVRNNKKNVLNKLMTDSGEQGEDSNNVNKKNDNNRKDLPYLIDSREQNNQIQLQPQNLNQYNTNSFNTNNINKEEYIREINKVLSHSPNLKIELMNSVSLPKGLTFDIIFLDPPYHTKEIENILNIINDNIKILSDNAIIVCETEIKIDYEKYNNLEIYKNRCYGSKIVTILKKK